LKVKGGTRLFTTKDKMMAYASLICVYTIFVRNNLHRQFISYLNAQIEAGVAQAVMLFEIIGAVRVLAQWPTLEFSTPLYERLLAGLLTPMGRRSALVVMFYPKVAGFCRSASRIRCRPADCTWMRGRTRLTGFGDLDD